MPVLEAAGRPFADVEHVGLALRRTPLGMHSGILYRLPNEEPRILHLAFHHDLQDEPAAPPYRWSELGLDEVNKEILTEILARIAHRNPQIAYGFDANGVAIDPDTGDVTPGPPGKGLTCSTFVNAVLRAYGFELIDITDWPQRVDDIPFHNTIVGYLNGKASSEHVDAVRQDIGARRLRPDEVVGAGKLPDEQWAVPFLAARAQGDVVQDEMAAH